MVPFWVFFLDIHSYCFSGNISPFVYRSFENTFGKTPKNRINSKVFLNFIFRKTKLNDFKSASRNYLIRNHKSCFWVVRFFGNISKLKVISILGGKQLFQALILFKRGEWQKLIKMQKQKTPGSFTVKFKLDVIYFYSKTFSSLLILFVQYDSKRDAYYLRFSVLNGILCFIPRS